jgi:hypothetical protein
MTFTYKDINFKENFFLCYNLIILFALTVFGTHFSKLSVYPNVYLHDLLLFVGAFFSLILNYKKVNYLPILLILFISLLYLSRSFYYLSAPIELIVRQFALFAYIGGYYLFNLENSKESAVSLIRKFLVGISLISILMQIMTVAYYLIQNNFDPFNYKNHYWFSPGVIIGLIISTGVALIYLRNWFWKISVVIVILLLSWTTGHASAQLSVLGVFFVYLILQLRKWKKLIPIVGGLALTLVLINKAPQFNDSNSDWRLLIWEYQINDLIKNGYGVLGNGFGVPYVNQELEVYLFEKISSTALQEAGKPDERYLTPPHNSFVTICFAIGILPGLLVFAPYFRIPVIIFSDSDDRSQFKPFILLSLIGLTIWCSFNVVLELPHCAGFFWLVYFTFVQVWTTRS